MTCRLWTTRSRIRAPLWLAVVLLAVSALAQTTATREQAHDLTSLASELRIWQSRIAGLEEGSVSPDRLPELPRYWRVRTPEGQVTVPTDWLALELKRIRENPGDPDLIRNLRRRLEKLESEVAAVLASQERPTPPPDRALLREILARDGFDALRESGALAQWLGQAWDWLEEKLSGLRSMPRPPLKQEYLFWVVLAAAFSVLALLVYRHVSQQGFGPGFRLPHAASLSEETPDWPEWVRRARRAAQNQDYREAVRCLYRAAVQKLESQDVWFADESRTHREYVRLLPASSLRRKDFGTVAEQFERTWYAGLPTGEEEFQETANVVETLS